MATKSKLFLTLLLTLSLFSKGQNKPNIDTSSIGTWPYLMLYDNSTTISSDGRYLAYITHNLPKGRATITFQDLESNWKKSTICTDPSIVFFSDNSKFLYWKQSDTLLAQKMGSDESKIMEISTDTRYPLESKGTSLLISIQNANYSYKLINLNTGKEFFLPQLKNYKWLNKGLEFICITDSKEFKRIDINKGLQATYKNVDNFTLSLDEKYLLLTIMDSQTPSLNILTLNNCEIRSIWKGNNNEGLRSIVFDPSYKKIAFTVRNKNAQNSIWQHDLKYGTSELLLSDDNTKLPSTFEVEDVLSYSSNSSYLFFNVKKQSESTPIKDAITSVEIWTYRDQVLYPAQDRSIHDYKVYSAALQLNNGQVQLIEKDDNTHMVSIINNNVIIETGTQSVGPWWPHNDTSAYWLQSLKDHTRTLIDVNSTGPKGGIMLTLSPTGRWIFYWDPILEDFISVDPVTGKHHNCTESLPFKVTDDILQTTKPLPCGIAGWYRNDSSVLIYDSYDIWKLDPSGTNKPVNITNGQGRSTETKLRLVYQSQAPINSQSEILLCGFNTRTKYNGFYNLRLLDNESLLQELCMGPYNYYQPSIQSQSFSPAVAPISGGTGKNKRWVVLRQSATEYPNLFQSKDLKTFTPITKFEPQKSLNWLTAEPVTWMMFNNQVNSGVLYKPENFDSTLKYPIIFNYYEKYSHRCYEFPMPGLTSHNINIPWFVSRGYLVFTPDIQFSLANSPKGMTITQSAFNAVASAAEYLSQKKYVDKQHMAIQGHSFGGHETNGIITQTNLFAAAAEVAGYSDHFSAYLTLVTADESSSVERAHKLDHGNQRMGATPWQRKDLFFQNSPALNADKISTPLLIVHNRKDGSVNFRQGIEMYMALRRLGKPCWLLQYDNSGHILSDANDALDYTIRLTQFFDHYLKKASAPQWMTRNDLSALKTSSLLFKDSSGNCNKSCQVCAEKNARHAESYP